MAKDGMTNVMMTMADRNAIRAYALRVSGEIGKQIPMGKLVGIMVSAIGDETVTEPHATIVQIARES
jgi:hypothetical protein